MTEPVVELRGLTKRFATPSGPLAAIDGLDASLAEAGFHCLLGPDGAGKTTLLRLLVGLLRPDAGALRVLGTDDPGRQRDRIGYMPQSFGLYQELTVQENLDLYADLQGLPADVRRRRFDELLSFTALERFAARPSGKLSGGMKQKLGLACTLIRAPRLLLLDEPSVGVDPVSRRELWDMVASLVQGGTTVLWSTAYLDEAERSDAILVLDRGRLVYSGPPERFTERMAGRAFVLSAPGVDLRRVHREAIAHPDLVDAVLRGRSLRLVTAADASPPPVEELLTHGESTAEAHIEATAPRLEDAYIAALRPAGGRLAGAETVEAARVAGEERPIVARGLTRRFGDFTAVDGVDFEVRRGEVFGLLGPNGAGKSTIFKMLCGLLPPSAGEARVAGFDLRHAAAEARGRIGYMAQQFSLYAMLSVRQNLQFFSGAYGLRGARRSARMAAVSAEFGLDAVAGQTAGSLPLGYKQRLSLACAVMHEPRILFLDEPTSGVDPLTRREFWTRINAMAVQGVTVLVTTHFMEEAEYCDRLAIIYQGRLIALGEPDRLRREHASAERPDPSIEDAFVDLIGGQAGQPAP